MKKRIYELDCARILVLLTLPFIHIMEFWGNLYDYADMLSLQTTNTLNIVCEILCIFVAPVFVVCMGINMSFTKKDSPMEFFKRGIFLLVLELILNIIRYEIPGVLSLLCATSQESKEMILFTMRIGIINSDILTLAGLSFIVFALFKKLNLKPSSIVIASIIIFLCNYVFANTLLPIIQPSIGFDVGNFFDNVIYLDENATFPLMEWLPYVSTGYYIGKKIKDLDKAQERNYFKKIGIISLIVFGSCLIYSFLFTDSVLDSLNKAQVTTNMKPLCIIGEISCAVFFICFVYMLYQILHLEDKEHINKVVKYFSNSVTYFYCIQWIIVGIGMMFGISLFFHSKMISLPATLIIYILICFISYYLGQSIHTMVINRKRSKEC